MEINKSTASAVISSRYVEIITVFKLGFAPQLDYSRPCYDCHLVASLQLVFVLEQWLRQRADCFSHSDEPTVRTYSKSTG